MKYFIILLITIFVVFECLSQTFPLSQNLVEVNTKSPEAASLGKFGNVPVSYFTGIPSISIPIYEISAGSISLPISLDYHAGGIRVDETSSSVGIGWALNGIGVISRNVVGRPDELQGGYIGAPDAEDVDFNDYLFLYDVRDGFRDSEPDIFQYNVNGLSGKFIFRNDGTIMQIPLTNNKIVFANGNFTITDASGNVYVFEEKRNYFNDDGVGGYPPQYVTTWCITRIVASNSIDVVHFSYEAGVYEVYETTVNFSASFGGNPSCGAGAPGSVDDFAGQVIPYTSTSKGSVLYEYYPKEISWRGGKLTFLNVEDRQDVSGRGLRLDAIEVYSYQNEIARLVKRTKLKQSYFYSTPPSGTSASARNYRLKLDVVESLDVGSGVPVYAYRMDYNNTPLPPRNSYAQDMWGFYNGHNENPSLMHAQTVIYKGQTHWLGDANRETDETKIVAGSLSSIEYPTKGKTIFEYEAHKFGAGVSDIGGGLRVKSITNYDVNGSFISRENYLYGTDGAGTMITPIFLQQITYETIKKRLGCPEFGCTYKVATVEPNFTTTYRANSVHAISQYAGSPIVYQKVTKMQVSSTGTANGKSVYGSIVYTDNFELGGNVGYSESKAGMYSISNAWKNGFLKYEETYKSTGLGDQLLSRSENYHSIKFSQSEDILKIRSIFSHSGCEAKTTTSASGDFILTVIPIRTGAMLLDSTVTTLRTDNGTEIVNTLTYGYGNTPLYPSRIETRSSVGEVLTQNIKYPLDLSSTGNVYQKMVDRNILSPVVQEQKVRNGHQLKLTKIQYNDWFSNSKLLLPQKISQQVASGPEETKVIFNAYDAYGNILDQQKANDMRHTYLWGYNLSLPIAQISNGVLSQSTENVNTTLTIPTVQVPGVGIENFIVINNGFDIDFTQNLTLNCVVNRGTASATIPNHYFNVTLSLVRADTQSEVYNGVFGLTTQSSYIINNLPAGRYIVRYRYDGNIGAANGFYFNSSIGYQVKRVYSTIFYTSFEEDIQGTSTEAHTGRQSHSGAYTIYLPKQTGEYLLSYWTKEGTANWQYQQEVISISSSASQSRTIGTGKLLDEVRLCPRNAQMTTYTYDPLIGMTSATDTNNLTTYYRYDSFGRLESIKDSDGNIVKHLKYGYSSGGN